MAIVVRLVVLWAGYEDLSTDPDDYRVLAENWASTGTFGFLGDDGAGRPTAFRPPLYPWMLSWGASVERDLPSLYVAILHLFLGLGTVILSWRLGRKIGIRAWVPAAAIALDPLLLRASQLPMTETAAAFFGVLCWWISVEAVAGDNKVTAGFRISTRHATWLVAGSVFGLAILLRPTFAPWTMLIALSITWSAFRRRNFKKQVFEILAFCFGVASCVLPWMFRNNDVLGKPIWATTHGGYTLLLANNPSLYEHFRANGADRNWDATSFHKMWIARHQDESVEWDSFWRSSPSTSYAHTEFLNSDQGELAENRLAYELASESIREKPYDFIRSCGYRLLWFWAIWPNDQGNWVVRTGVGLWYGCWLGMAALGLLRLRKEQVSVLLPGLLLLISLSFVHSIYWSNMRMRSPLMVVVYLAGSISVSTQRGERQSAGNKEEKTQAEETT